MGSPSFNAIKWGVLGVLAWGLDDLRVPLDVRDLSTFGRPFVVHDPAPVLLEIPVCTMPVLVASPRTYASGRYIATNKGNINTDGCVSFTPYILAFESKYWST